MLARLSDVAATEVLIFVIFLYSQDPKGHLLAVW